ncbi:hypothetical protein [Terrimicrobium sacchariphilum]|uniref:hypothetical protein n=1 Tax=Terrimicrobium sacchariphilum TaxID=690879 RepID=UPI0009464B8F|nr:hypothetical protein [Terrimicrobium sacchariphilum]
MSGNKNSNPWPVIIGFGYLFSFPFAWAISDKLKLDGAGFVFIVIISPVFVALAIAGIIGAVVYSVKLLALWSDEVESVMKDRNKAIAERDSKKTIYLWLVLAVLVIPVVLFVVLMFAAD